MMGQSRLLRIGAVVLLLGIAARAAVELPQLFSQDNTSARPWKLSVPVPVSQASVPASFDQDQSAPNGSTFPGGSTEPFGSSASMDAAGSTNGGSLPGGMAGSVGSMASGMPMAGAPGMMGGGSGGDMGMSGMGMPGMGMSGMSGMGIGVPQNVEEQQLAQEIRSALQSYARANPEVKDSIKSRVRKLLHRQFQLQHERRNTELANIERRVAELRQRLNRRAESEGGIVDLRLVQLINEVEGLGWSGDELPADLLNGSIPQLPEGPGAFPGPGMFPGSGMLPRGPGAGSLDVLIPDRGPTDRRPSAVPDNWPKATPVPDGRRGAAQPALESLPPRRPTLPASGLNPLGNSLGDSLGDSLPGDALPMTTPDLEASPEPGTLPPPVDLPAEPPATPSSDTPSSDTPPATPPAANPPPQVNESAERVKN